MLINATDINIDSPVISGFGNDSIKVTQQYFTKNQKPWLPIMGEFHYSRFLKEDWENEILKMKDGGIDIISSYVFWIHHEEKEGIFDWQHNKNLREFILLCQKHSIYFFLRPGPWAHGECRNGGFPDWLLKKCEENVRCVSEPYIGCVKRFFTQIAKQVEGLTNVVGIQVENEFVDNPDYLLKIKDIITQCGMDAPIFTATAWGCSPQIPHEKLLPIHGGYPEAPWEQHTNKLPPNCHYFFNQERNDSIIGNDLMKINKIDKLKEVSGCYNTPFITCEAGGGNQVTYHRRPIIKPKDVSTLAFTLLGSGCNMLGYYMYHGGANSMGEDTTLQESRETGYLNDYPIISYDFQSPLGECGQFRESYYELALIHSFVKSYECLLCTMPAVFPNELPKGLEDNETLRCVVRTNGESGFVFINHYQRLQPLVNHEDITLDIQLKNETVTLCGINVVANNSFILPFNLTIGTKILKYALVQPLSIEGNVFSFLEIEGMKPYLYFEDCKILLTKEGYFFDDMQLRLVKKTDYKLTIGKEVNPVPIENTIDFSCFEYLGFTDKTKEFSLKWQEDFAYLKLNCMGNVAHAYYEGKLVADWFCNGTDWVIDVRSFQMKELIIKIQPLSMEDEIYFEVDMEKETVGIHALGMNKGDVHI